MYHVYHYSDVIMGAVASQITGVSIIYSDVCSGAYQSKHQSATSLAFVLGIHKWLANSLHKGPLTRKIFRFDGIIMVCVDTEPIHNLKQCRLIINGFSSIHVTVISQEVLLLTVMQMLVIHVGVDMNYQIRQKCTILKSMYCAPIGNYLLFCGHIFCLHSPGKNLVPLENVILNAGLRRKLKSWFYLYNLQQKSISSRKTET